MVNKFLESELEEEIKHVRTTLETLALTFVKGRNVDSSSREGAVHMSRIWSIISSSANERFAYWKDKVSQ